MAQYRLQDRQPAYLCPLTSAKRRGAGILTNAVIRRCDRIGTFPVPVEGEHIRKLRSSNIFCPQPLLGPNVSPFSKVIVLSSKVLSRTSLTVTRPVMSPPGDLHPVPLFVSQLQAWRIISLQCFPVCVFFVFSWKITFSKE